MSSTAIEPAAASHEQVSYSQSGGLMSLLARTGISIAFTSYQSGILYLLGQSQTGAHLHRTGIGRPMGLAYNGNGGLLVAGANCITVFENPLAPHERVNDQFDACYVPRQAYYTGDLDVHDVGFDGSGRPVFVNTKFNCLAATDSRHSFREIWRPSFISSLVNEDRCHLNGMAMEDGAPAFVTAVSRSDTVDGWRDRRQNGGVVIDVRTNSVVCEGLSMPHSPRIHRGEVWVLNAGTGELGVIEGLGRGKGHFVPRVFCPGFLRGLAFTAGYAIVGLSRPRHERFEGLALDERLQAADSEPWCGIQVIDLARGTCVEWFRIDGDVSELYDVAVLDGVTCPMAVSPGSPEAADFLTWASSSENLAASPSDAGEKARPSPLRDVMHGAQLTGPIAKRRARSAPGANDPTAALHGSVPAAA